MLLSKRLHLKQATLNKVKGVIFQEDDEFFFLSNSSRLDGNTVESCDLIKGYRYSWYIGYEGDTTEDIVVHKEKADVEIKELTPYEYLKSREDDYCEEGKETVIFQALKFKLGQAKVDEILNSITRKEARKILKDTGYSHHFPEKMEKYYFKK